MEVNPLSIILVKSDSKGDRLLFRYPYDIELSQDTLDPRNGKKNPYAFNVTEDLLQTPSPITSNIQKGQLTGFTDEVLSTLFAVKSELCHRKFELKVNDVRFVGHPTLLPFRANKDDGTSSTILINIVFALQAQTSHSVVRCYYDLSERLGKALRHEEKRCAYLSEEMKIMIQIHDELSAIDSDSDEMQDPMDNNLPSSPAKSPFHLILQKSTLAQSLKSVFEDLCSTGIVQSRINQWVLVSFCLPHKAHQFHNKGHIIEPETIERCLRNLRPYHGILLLVEPNELLETIPLDSNPCLIRILLLYSPLKSLQAYALEADMPLSQVFQVTGHLVYWAKATIIYPLCESNVYVIAPDAQVYLNSPLVEKFALDFPGSCLIQVVSMLSLPAPLWFHARAWAGGAALLAKCIVWMLQRHLLLQLHTYVQFLPTPLGPPLNGTKNYYCGKHNGIRPTISDSFVSLNLIPQSSAYTPSEDLSIDYINFKVKDHNDNGIRSNKNHWSNGDTYFDNDYKMGRNYNNNVKAMLRSPNSDSTISNHKSENPKTVFRENSLIFGDITCDSSISSNPSSPQSYNMVDNMVKVNFDIVDKTRKDSSDSTSSENNCKDSFEHSAMFTLDSADSSYGNNINLGMYLSDYGKTSDVPIKELSNKYKSNDVAFTEIDSCISKVVNGVNNMKLDEHKSQTNGSGLNLIGEKDKLMTSLNTSNSSSGSNLSERRQSSIKHLDTSFQSSTAISTVNSSNSCDVVDAPKSATIMNGNAATEPPTIEMLLSEFSEEEKNALFKIPAAHNPDDLTLICTLYKKGYFRGEQHLEEIMFMENLTRSQVLQLLDKFRDVLITYETEDPTVTMVYSSL